MSKKTKTMSQLKRKREKAARKASQAARYESYMRLGMNTKSKRNTFKNRGKAKAIWVGHSAGQCENVGCNRCFGIRFNNFLVNGNPKSMPNWMWHKWMALNDNDQAKYARRS